MSRGLGDVYKRQVFALEHFQIKDKVEQLEQLLGRLIEEKRK